MGGDDRCHRLSKAPPAPGLPRDKDERKTMNTMARFTVAALATLGLAAPVLAHHSAAAFDTQKQVTVTGTVTQYRFANPHVYLTIQVRKDDGSINTMEVEAGAASVLNALGFNAS